MHIQSTRIPSKNSNNKLLVSYEGNSKASVTVGLADVNEREIIEEKPSKDKSDGLVKKVLANGATLGTVYKGGNYLISGIHNITAADLAPKLQNLHLVNDGSIAHQKSEEILAIVQSKAASSILIGAQAGTLTFAVVDIIVPRWELKNKLIVSFLVAAIVGGSIFIFFNDETPSAEISAVDKKDSVK